MKIEIENEKDFVFKDKLKHSLYKRSCHNLLILLIHYAWRGYVRADQSSYLFAI